MSMTESEAKKEIEHNVFCNTDDFEMKISKECYKTIINALEKQIAKKSKIYNDKYFDMFDCPNCKQTFDAWEGYSYCPECGQKLNLEA